jgi:hypothetical protein
LEGLKKLFFSSLEGPGPMCLNWQFLFVQVLAKAANGAAIGSTLAASSYLSQMHGEEGDFLRFFKKGDENSLLGRLEALQNYFKNTENGSLQKRVDHWKGQKNLYPIIESPYGISTLRTFLTPCHYFD